MVHIGIAPEALDAIRSSKSVEELRTAVANGIPCIVIETGEKLGRLSVTDALEILNGALNGGAC